MSRVYRPRMRDCVLCMGLPCDTVLRGRGLCCLGLSSIQIHHLLIITRFQSEDQVCISTTLRELDKSVLTQTCRCESQSTTWQCKLHLMSEFALNCLCSWCRCS